MVHVVMRVSICLLLLLFFVGNPLSARGASQQVCLPTIQGSITTPPEQAGTVLINEALLSSKQPWSCPGSTSVPATTDTSWLELYNPMALAFDIYGVHAAIDNGPNTTPIYFTFGSAIAAHGFLIIFLPQSSPQSFNRRLLFHGTVIDDITVPSNIGSDQSYARTPDGASKWEITNTPTIGLSNVLPTPTPKTTPKPTPTPHPVATKKKSSGNKLSVKTSSRSTPGTTSTTHRGTTASAQSSPPIGVNGVQPPWHQLQLPGTPSSSQNTTATVVPADTPATTANAPLANNDNADVPRKMLFTGMALACAGTLFWWWRRFIRS